MARMRRYDVDHLAQATLEEVALLLAADEGAERPISHEGIRQLQERALKKLEAGLRAAGYSLEDLLPG